VPETEILCPFCNSRIEGAIDRTKPTCPRCEAPLPAGIVEKLPSAPAPPPPMPTVPGKSKTILAVLGLMAFMAALTAAYALWTKDFRRQNDVKKGFVAAPAASQAPAEMNALGLIPAKCNVLGAVNLADLRANPVAKKALFEQPPRSVAWLAEQLKEATGLTLDDLDQVALGIEVADKLPNIYVVVQTRAAYDRQAVLKPFAPAKPHMLRDRPLVQFPLPRLGDGVVWCVSERHLAFLFRIVPGKLEEGELEAIPKRPRQKLEGSSDAVKKLVSERVDKESFAWLAGDLSLAAGLLDFLAIAGARIEPYRPLLGAKAVALNVKTDQDVVVLAHVLPGSAKEAEALANSLRDFDWRGESSKKVETTPPDAAALPWVSLQLRYRPDTVRELLERGPGMKK
jgi:hypothetical protein